MRLSLIHICLICSLPQSASASAPTSPDGGRVITITQEELTSLQQIFSELSSSNQLSQKRYSELLDVYKRQVLIYTYVDTRKASKESAKDESRAKI